MGTDLSEYQAILLDLDGTLYHEDHALPGAPELVRRLQEEGRLFACLSNSTSSPLRIMDRLHRMGIDITPDQIYTAAAAAADYVVQRYHPDPNDPLPRHRPAVYNLATDGLAEMLDGLVDWVNSADDVCDVVIAGAPSNVYATEDRQRAALTLLRNGSDLIGICADRVYPSPRGIEFGSGSLCAFLGYAADVKPFFCGKPERIFFENLCHRLGVSPGGCVLIGDNLESDIYGARGVGMRAILTLTGVTRRSDLSQVPRHLAPDAIVADLTELA